MYLKLGNIVVVSRAKRKKPMYRKILVAVDETELSKQAFQKAISIAKAFDAKLLVIHVVSPPVVEYQNSSSLIMGDVLYPEMSDNLAREEFVTLEERGWNLLRSLQEEAQKAGIKVEVVEQIGQPEQEISQFAKTWNADLIVIGSHGRKGLGELLFGSTSNYVSHHVNCSVLLVHQQEKLTISAEEFIE